MESIYTFTDKLIIRLPKLPFHESVDEKLVHQLINNNSFIESIYLASPILWEYVNKYKRGDLNAKKLKSFYFSIAKYYLRMSNRCTPFGLFAGPSIVEWGNETDINIDTREMRRNTKLDYYYLHNLYCFINSIPIVRDNLRYFPNYSILNLDETLHFTEYKNIKTGRIYTSTIVQNSDYLNKILELAKAGANPKELIDFLTKSGVLQLEAENYINEIINSAIIVSELEMRATGPDPLDFLINVIESILSNVNDNKVRYLYASLKELRRKLQSLDEKSTNAIKLYKDTLKILNRFKLEYDESKVFNCMMYPVLNKKGFLCSNFQNDLLDVMQFIGRISEHSRANVNLKWFANKFYEKYENRKIKLLEALDETVGIGYINDSGDTNNLVIDDINYSYRENSRILWGKVEDFLLAKLQDAIYNNKKEIELTKKDLNNFPEFNWNILPPSFSIIFRLLKNDKLYYEHASCSSAINFLSRFASSNEGIAKVINGIVQNEEDHNIDVIFAEILYYPAEVRALNVLQHPSFRKYEIPVFSNPNVQEDRVINLSDLYLYLEDGKIILYSDKLKKCVIPRLSNLHNFSIKSHPLYYFLCDLQFQNKTLDLSFKWLALEKQYKYLPRVSYKNIVLSPSIWNFEYQDVQEYLSKFPIKEAISKFRDKWYLPSLIILFNSDNELLINFDNDFSIDLFLAEIKNKTFSLKEFLPNINHSIHDVSGNLYANQFVASLTKNAPSYSKVNIETSLWIGKKRRFDLGSEWLYYNIYCNEKVADRILVYGAKPLVDTLFDQGLITKYFFIRYNNPTFHLRLRLCLCDQKNVNNVIKVVAHYLADPNISIYIDRLQTDSYIRELERYEYADIEDSEILFYYDSLCAIDIISYCLNNNLNNKRWLYSIVCINNFLNAFRLKNEEKKMLFKELNGNYKVEFGVEQNILLKRRLTEKYRLYRDDVKAILNEDFDPTIQSIIGFRLNSDAQIIEPLLTNNKSNTQKFRFITSHVHMHINRLMAANPRLYELLIYELMYHCYYSAQE